MQANPGANGLGVGKATGRVSTEYQGQQIQHLLGNLVLLNSAYQAYKYGDQFRAGSNSGSNTG
jgi:hypothetical protein